MRVLPALAACFLLPAYYVNPQVGSGFVLVALLKACEDDDWGSGSGYSSSGRSGSGGFSGGPALGLGWLSKKRARHPPGDAPFFPIAGPAPRLRPA